MKKLSKIKLTQLNSAELEAKEQRLLLGGSSESCTCTCAYEGSGGSTRAVNGSSNWNKGLDSVGGSGAVYGSCSCTSVVYPGTSSGSTTSDSNSNKWG